MNERRRPPRRGRGGRPYGRPPAEGQNEPNPYRDAGDAGAPAPAGGALEPERGAPEGGGEIVGEVARTESPRAEGDGGSSPAPVVPFRQQQQFNNNGGAAGHRRNRRHRGRGGPRREQQERGPAPAVVADAEVTGWYDMGRDGGYVRRAANSYLAEQGDAFVPLHVARQFGLRRGDLVNATTGRDHRGRTTVVEAKSVNGHDPAEATRRPEFASLTACYPDRKLKLETGRPAKGGAELIRRAIDLIAPIGYGQRGLIVAPARAGKTTLLHAITEGVALNHPSAALLILLVDERPEEVSEAISWGVGEVIASSFDMPAQRHVEVTEMVLERARRLVEQGKDVVIVLDSLTRMARAHNTAERGTGRTLSGGLDATAMAKPKAFFGSARAVAPEAGGGSLTIIATALVETGSRMDDVIFEEFKGTGNCEIKLDRSLAEKRIYPAFDIAASGTRREEKLFRPDQLDSVYTLRRGLQQMPPQAAMEWLIKRIAATPSNDALLAGL
jgi:transcription termination factor Rho